MTATNCHTTVRTWSAALMAILGLGCGPSSQSLEEGLTEVLREYVAAQETHHVTHGRYVGRRDSLTLTTPGPPRLWLVIHSATSTGHRASAKSLETPELMCMVFVGRRPGELDHGTAGEPICGATDSLSRFTTGWRPSETTRPGQIARLLWAGGIGLLAACMMYLWVPACAPWGYRVVFWTPATLSAGLLLLTPYAAAGGVGSGTGTAGYGILALIMISPGLLLNLSFFAVPRAIMRAGRRFPVGTAVCLSLGMLLYGVLSVMLADPDHFEGEAFPVVAALFLLNLFGVLFIAGARRRHHKHGGGPDDDLHGVGTEINPTIVCVHCRATISSRQTVCGVCGRSPCSATP